MVNIKLEETGQYINPILQRKNETEYSKNLLLKKIEHQRGIINQLRSQKDLLWHECKQTRGMARLMTVMTKAIKEREKKLRDYERQLRNFE